MCVPCQGYRAVPEEAGPLSPNQLCFPLPGQLGANSLGAASPPCVPLASCCLWPILFTIYHSRALTCEGDTRDRSRQGSVMPEVCACVRALVQGWEGCLSRSMLPSPTL